MSKQPEEMNIMNLVDSFARHLYDTACSSANASVLTIEDKVNVFKELRQWITDRHSVLENAGTGGAISEYQKGIKRNPSGDGGSDAPAATGSAPRAKTGILEQLARGTARKGRPPAGLPAFIEGTDGDSGGSGPGKPAAPLSAGSIRAGSVDASGADDAENNGHVSLQ